VTIPWSAEARSACSSRLLAVQNPQMLRLPALVRGELVWPAQLTADELEGAVSAPGPARIGDTYVVRGSTIGARQRFLVMPYADPAELIEHDRTHLSRCLHNLPFDSVLDYVGDLTQHLRTDGEVVREALAAFKADSVATEPGGGVFMEAVLGLLPGLFDPRQVQSAVAAELDHSGVRGRDLLDGWVPMSGRQEAGVNMRIADAVFGSSGSSGPVYRHEQALLRAIPTRQLHITASNAPVIPALSLLRAVATKGAAVVKCSARSWLVSTILIFALEHLRDHPITHHLSLVYWCGGDSRVEKVLLANDAFDRVVAWGGAEAVSSIRSRTTIPTILFEPRVGISLIGRGAFESDLRETVVRAVADSLVENQAACTASLVHYVEADDSQALQYCRALQMALAQWDAAVPHELSQQARGLMRRMRREALVGGRWFVNGTWSHISSAVVYAPHSFDLSVHPMSRCIVVRRVDSLEAALEHVDRRVSAAGVWPKDCWVGLRDLLAARGVTTVAPLGESERRWAGMPHDGTRPLDRLVNWTVA
jgi:hypothetical protein